MKNPMTMVKEHSLRASLILPLACSAAFTGCSSIDATSRNQPIKSKASPYTRPNQEKPATTAGDYEEYPGYEWWY